MLAGQRIGSAAYKSRNAADFDHYFPNIVDNYASQATKFDITGGDGTVRQLYQVSGSLSDGAGVNKTGIFE